MMTNFQNGNLIESFEIMTDNWHGTKEANKGLHIYIYIQEDLYKPATTTLSVMIDPVKTWSIYHHLLWRSRKQMTILHDEEMRICRLPQLYLTLFYPHK